MELNETVRNCPLCVAAETHAIFMSDINVNTILGSSGNLLIIPALGPLVVGHVLVISTEHTAGLQYLSAEVQHGYKRLSAKIRQYCARLGDTVLEAEHGAYNGAVRGPCIRHTHIHILPGLGNAAKIFDKRPSLEDANCSSSNLVGSYLWINDGNCDAVYDASQVIGQEIRQTVGEYLGVDDWDWAINPKTVLIKHTIEYWNGMREWLA
jgi:diadenosine tetraphosphate (Ap4A) HIT family hydrolase